MAKAYWIAFYKAIKDQDKLAAYAKLAPAAIAAQGGKFLARGMPSKTGFVYHDAFLDHDTGAGHAERPDRLRAVTARLKASGTWQRLQHLLLDPAEEEHLLAVHSAEHIRLDRKSTRLNSSH